MNLSDLKQAVGQIEMNDNDKQNMIRNLKAGGRKAYGCRRVIKIAAAAVMFVLGMGALSIPVRALVASLVQERMEELPREEVEETLEQMDKQMTDGDSFSREYTKKERTRWTALYQEYRNGTFPREELPQVDSDEEAENREFCYLTTIGKFYLPEGRELTDEEILEIIDFNQKRDYALLERHKAEDAEEIALKQEAEKEQISKIVAGGGVTEQEAAGIAEGYLESLFGLNGSGMEFHQYYSAEEADVKAAYHVNWGIQSQLYYYFTIDAENGQLLEVLCSKADWMSEEYQSKKPALEDASAVAASIRKQAEDFLSKKLEIDEAWEKVESCYYTVNGKELGRFLNVILTRADGTACQLGYSWEGELKNFSWTTAQAYEKSIESARERSSEKLTEERGEKVTVEAVRESSPVQD